jgi:DNA-directed RNA polymerase specialized sigma24 family protein
LIEAMRAHQANDPLPLDTWDRDTFPILRRALACWARDIDLGARLACRVMRAAFRAVRAGSKIRCERSWMAGVVRRGRAKILTRERQGRTMPLPDDVEARATEPIVALARLETCDRVRRAIARLPMKYEVLLSQRYILDHSERETAAHAERRFGIRLEATRSRLKKGREMVRIAVKGGDPRVVFPQRYARDEKSEQSCVGTHPSTPSSGT